VRKMVNNIQKQRREKPRIDLKAYYALFFIIVMVNLMAVPLISAWEVDNLKDYDSNSKTISVRNSFFKIFPLGKVADIQLKSDLIEYVIKGDDRKVAEFEITSYEDYNNAFKEMEFYNKNNMDREISRSFTYKYKDYYDVEIQDYKEVCSEREHENKSIEKYNCYTIKDGTHINTYEEWIEFEDLSELKQGTYTVGIFTDVNEGEHVEWIPTFFGVRIQEWASWQESFNTDIRHGWLFDSNFTDVIGGFDGTAGDGAVINTTFKKLGDGSAESVSGDSHIVIGDIGLINETYKNGTIMMWFKQNDLGVQDMLFASDNFGTTIEITSANVLSFLLNDGVNPHICLDANTSVSSGWNLLTMTWGAKGMVGYINGSTVCTDTFTGNSTGGNIWFFEFPGDASGTIGNIDEAYIWNRALSQEEITSIWNDGEGLQYTEDVFQAPQLTLNSPANDTRSTTQTVTLNCSATDPVGSSYSGLYNMTLMIDNIENYTITNSTAGNLSMDIILPRNFAEGDYNWSCKAHDGFSVTTSDTYVLKIDSSNPVISISEPSGNASYGYVDKSENFNWTITDLNVDSCIYNYNGTNISVTCNDNSTLFDLELNNYDLTFWVNDTLGHTTSTTIEWGYYVFERSSSFSSAVYESDIENISVSVNVPGGLLAISASLFYNGTEHSSTVTNPVGNTFNVNNSLEIPLIITGGTQDFYWNFDFTLTNGSDVSVNSSTNSQTVDRTWLLFCNSTINKTFINFSTYDAENPFPALNATFKINWEWYINTSSGTVKRNDSWEDITEKNGTWSFCGSPPERTFDVTGSIEYDGTGWAKNFYYLNNEQLSNGTTNISLYLLNDSSATLTVLRVVDTAQQPLQDYSIEVKLFDIGTGTYYTVAMGKTSFNGEDLAYLNWYDTLYKFIIKDEDGVEVLNTEPYKISETPQIFEIATTTTYDFDKFGDITYSLTFNETTESFTLTYTKPDDVDEACLRVIKRNITRDTEICLICKTAASATISCSVTSYTPGLFLAAFYGTGSLSLIDVYQVFVDVSNEIYDAIGKIDATGMAIIFAGITASMFFISPIMGIIGIILGMLGALALGFQPLNGEFYPAYIGIILIGGFVAWLINK